MSKNRDYTKYSKEPIENKNPIEDKNPIEVVAEDISTTEEIKQEPKAEEVTLEPKIEETNYVTGIVTDCAKLNVRESPYPTATILGVISASTELIVDKAESTEDFYKICTSVGLEGYCMKRYITIMP